MYSSFWGELLPFAEGFVRSINRQAESYTRPIPSEVSSERRAFVGELSFNLIAAAAQRKVDLKTITEEVLTSLAAETDRAMAHFRDYSRQREEYSRLENTEALKLARKAWEALRGELLGRPTVCVRPRFEGCGIIDDCEGDLLVGETLFEFKAVARAFRSVDFRQVLVYLALNYSRPIFVVSSVVLFNQRQGIVLRLSVSDLIHLMSGRTPPEVFSEVVEYISSEFGSDQ